MINSRKYKHILLFECMLSEPPVSNGSYLLSENMPTENIKCYKTTLNYIFAEKCFNAQHSLVWGRGLEDSP